VAAIGRDYLYARVGTSVMNDLRLRMFEHLQQPVGELLLEGADRRHHVALLDRPRWPCRTP
jgi:hypothetical protein